MREPVRIVLPDEAYLLRGLEAGAEAALSGVVFTARDATHVRLVADLERLGALPYGLAGQALFYAGPTPPRPGRPAGSVGPTTASRMDAWTPQLLRAGIVATIGKGPRSEEVRRACAETGAVYLVAVGGAAALLGERVVHAEVVAYPELGPEALVRLELRDLPVFVGIDATGGDLYASVAARSTQESS
ncbi:MAG: fumarate hydratase C-terminal domain-containing protein [Anaerosomatales bacterium]|nr:fumarate hydratase C-terminal domain-containing protein [Anaerosomatales bacterium]